MSTPNNALSLPIPTMKHKPVKNPVTKSGVIEKIADSTLDKGAKLEMFIEYLNQIKNLPVADYISQARALLRQLVVEFKEQKESYLPWVRFFDIVHLHKSDKFGAGGAAFKKQIEEMVSQELPSVDISTEKCSAGIDWRIAVKMLSLQTQFTPYGDLETLKQGILESLKTEINLALEHLLWKKKTLFTDLTKRSLEALLLSYESQDGQKRLLEAMTSGRFDKAKLGLEYTLIIGEDGGLYALLNRLSKIQQEALVSEDIVTEEYLKDKIKEGKKEAHADKVVLGEGGFGIVKFALSLLNSRSLSSEVICIKKTKSFKKLSQDTFKPTPLQQIVESTIGDYFTNDRAIAIYSPIIFDMALIHNKVVNPQGSTQDHRKGYLMIEIVPQNTATRIFADKQYQKWEYQKPYLLDVLRNTQKLLDNDIAMTDLKPDNTLYDTNLRKATIIDLGGSTKVASAKELVRFDLAKYPFQSTKGYRAPEIDNNKGVVDISKSLAFSCGKIIQEITRGGEKLDPILEITKKLTEDRAEKRLSISEAIKQIERIGEDSYKQSIIFSHYISKVKDRLQNRRSAISINENIQTTQELYIALDTTSSDSLKYKNLQTQDLFKKIDDFLAPENPLQVMAIFGAAGSGKSIALQLKFIEAVNTWQLGKPLPIYFNLADGTDLDQVLRALNIELGTDLKPKDLREQHLYIDSFDEGLGIEHKKERLVRSYYQKIGGPPHKMLITCRTDYLHQDENWQKWFTPPVAESEKRLEVCYVAPINYNGLDQKLPEMVQKYVDHYRRSNEKNNLLQSSRAAKDYLDKLRELQVTDLIDTGFMFFLVLEVLFSLKNDESALRRINKLDIYAGYVRHYQNSQIGKLNQKQKKKLQEILNSTRQKRGLSAQPTEEEDINSNVQELGNYIANQLHLKGQTRLEHPHELFASLGFDNSQLLKHQSVYQILRLLPLKIETTQSGKRIKLDQQVKIGFIHDTLKNYYLLESIKSEIKRDSQSLILANKSIVEDKELIKMIVLGLGQSPELEDTLNDAIINSKQNKAESSIIYASNSITTLVAAKHSFSGHDLSNISVRGANLTHGIFYKTKLHNADLSNAKIRYANLIEATLDRADMTKVDFAILPHIEVFSAVNSACFSSNGKMLVTGSADNKIQLWNPTSGQCLYKLQGHSNEVNSVSFSPDGKLLASGSDDNTVMLWKLISYECVRTLKGHNHAVTSVCFSPNGKLVVSSSKDCTIKLWNPTSGECVKTLQGHDHAVTSVCFSLNGKLLASSSEDETIKLWNPASGDCLRTLKGHEWKVRSVCFSSDSKLLVSGSDDKTIKLWDSTSGECLQTLEGHTHWVSSVSFSPNGKFLVSSSYDKTIKLWSSISGECLHTLQGHSGKVNSVSFSSDGKLLVSGSEDEAIKLWDPTFNECLQELQGHREYVRSVSFSPDGKFLGSCSSDQTIKLWNPTSGECLHTLKGHRDKVNSVSFSPNSKLLASASDDETIKLWNPTSGECLHTLKEHRDKVNSVNFSPNGNLLASGSWDNTIRLWNPTSGACLKELKSSDVVLTVNFSPDGDLLAGGFWDNTVKLWNPTSGDYLKELKGHTSEVNSVSFSPNGELLLSGSDDKEVKLWDPVSGMCLLTLRGHTSAVNSVGFSPDGNLLISGSKDKTIKLWNPKNGKCLHTLNGHTLTVNSVSFSPDSKLLVSGSDDKTIKIFHQNSQMWLLKDNITATLSPLLVDSATLKNTKISTLNRRIFEQNGAYVESCEADDEKKTVQLDHQEIDLGISADRSCTNSHCCEMFCALGYCQKIELSY